MLRRAIPTACGWPGWDTLSREFGSYDPVKAVDLLRKAADPAIVAMAQFAYSLRTGRGGLTRDDAKALDYLRRAADAGYTARNIPSPAGRWSAMKIMKPRTLRRDQVV